MIDEELAAIVETLPPIDYRDVAGIRAAIAELTSSMRDTPIEQVTRGAIVLTEDEVPERGGSPAVPVRIYRPTGADLQPALVYFHGGGFVIGEPILFDALCADLAIACGATVVSVDYRLAPEHRYPAAVDDCYGALEWTHSQAARLEIDPTAIAVGGLSAGGGLAAAVALMARDRGGPGVAFQLLLNPVLDDRVDSVSATTMTDVPLWTSQDVAAMWDQYLGPERGAVASYAAPARERDLSGLPPAYVQTCELDPLRDEGIAYASRMMQAGVPVELHNIVGVFHGFDAFPSEVSRAAVASQHAALTRAFRRRPVDVNV